MDSAWLWRNVLTALSLPPANLLLLSFIACLSYRKFSRFSRTTIALSIVLFWALSTRFVGGVLMQSLHLPTAVSISQLEKMPASEQAQVIVVLGGGRYLGALEAPQTDYESLHPLSLVRVRYAAQLVKGLHLPILVTGGKPDGGHNSEAALMAQMLENELNVPVKWQEGHSRITQENASMSAPLLKAANVKRILLVTHAWHMPRAKAFFEQQGFQVIAAPCGFSSEPKLSVLDFIPNAEGLTRSRIALREIMGQWIK